MRSSAWQGSCWSCKCCTTDQGEQSQLCGIPICCNCRMLMATEGSHRPAHHRHGMRLQAQSLQPCPYHVTHYITHARLHG